MLTCEGFASRFGQPALIGMVHLAPLPGSPLWGGSLDEVIERAFGDASNLADAGFDALIVENFGDRPFAKTVEPETIAAMSIVIDRIAAEISLPIGVNVLRNDARAALAIASVSSAAFIRVNVHVGTMATDQGLIEGAAAETLRARRALGADAVAIFADLLVKHAEPVVTVDPVGAARELRERGLADAILVTGASTGSPADIDLVRQVRDGTDAPVVVASGVSEENALAFSEVADGLVVGTSIKENTISEAPVDLERAKRLVALLK